MKISFYRYSSIHAYKPVQILQWTLYLSDKVTKHSPDIWSVGRQAVKHAYLMQVQHPGLLDTYAADVATVAVLVYAVRLIFPDFDYSWLVQEIRRTLPKVLQPILPSFCTCQIYLNVHLPFGTGHGSCIARAATQSWSCSMSSDLKWIKMHTRVALHFFQSLSAEV